MGDVHGQSSLSGFDNLEGFYKFLETCFSAAEFPGIINRELHSARLAFLGVVVFKCRSLGGYSI